jgi:hypothetical protein
MRNRVRGKRIGSPIRSLRIEISRRNRIKKTNSKINRIRKKRMKGKKEKRYARSKTKKNNHIC